ncbi:Putative maintenance of telomere capping protein [Septoria linicola]|uniref:Maintenance of telomere capping protein n=1 Tax=Septoria linicola TaxID=215465 RepID=A0A9Q9AI79_9PEZI|nr:Putative maintenance of telomere capping protein [Septoria linicola]
MSTHSNPDDVHPKSSPAADVSFSPVDTLHAESSSQAQSRSSSARRSDHSITDRLRASGAKRLSLEDAGKSDTSSHSRIPQRIRKPGGFLLGSVLSNGHARGPETPLKPGKTREQTRQNGGIRVDKRRSNAPRVSGESSHRSSPLSHEIASDGSPNAGAVKQRESSQPSLDPAQLVQMALNLSESRKRHVSNTLPVPVAAAGGRRVVSALDSGYGTVRSASSGGKRASYSNDSRIPTPTSHRRSPLLDESPEPPNAMAQNVVYTFSPATLSRAEKARRYFELASEHRRLLENLPPLKPDAVAPGNYTMQVTSSPGSAHYHMTRITSTESIHKHKLGRSYNPLQALRNRRLRNRERRPLTAPTETFQETDRIRRWIDGVEAAAKEGSFRPGEDQVRLPPFSGELDSEPTAQPGEVRGHRRTDTVNSVVTRPANAWTIEPAELLADTYWIEKNDNKTVVEDRHGNRIFPARPRASLEVPRRSKDITRRSLDADRYDKYAPHQQSDSDQSGAEDQAKTRHKHKHILPLPRLGRNHISRSGSVTSASSDEGRKPPALRFGHDEGGDENIGPLERHMREMIAKDEQGELSSPELVSPDHWDFRNSTFANARGSMDQSRQEAYRPGQGRLSVDTQRIQRSRSGENRASIDHGLASMDEMVVDSPTSPVMPNFSRKNTADSATSKQTSPVKQKAKALKLPIFHSRSKSKERNQIDATDFANTGGVPLSPVLSADSNTELPRSSIDSTRPPHFRRHKTSESIDSELRRTDTSNTTAATSARDSKSSSNRFFKGGRVRDLVRNESSRLGDRFRNSREGVNVDSSVPHSDNSDADADSSVRRGANNDFGGLEDGISPRASLERERPKSKYFIPGLPSFKSPAARDRTAPTSPTSEDSNPFDRMQANPRSRRGDLPTINLPDEGNASEPELSPSRSKNALSWAEDYKRRGSLSHNDLTLVDTESSITNMKVRGSNTPMSGKRHWSISDHAQREQHAKSTTESDQSSRVTTRDVARVRALLLASGIEAQELCKLAHTSRQTPLPLIVKAAETAGQELGTLNRKEENVVAGKWLSGMLDGTTSEIEKLLQHFQTGTVRDLSTQLEELSHKAGDQLAKLVHETSDEADAFNVELTTKMPQDVKRMDSTIDSMFRARRKNLKLVVNFGFKLFEWFLLGIMWSVWLTVVVINSVKKIVLFFVRILKWLLWF